MIFSMKAGSQQYILTIFTDETNSSIAWHLASVKGNIVAFYQMFNFGFSIQKLTIKTRSSELSFLELTKF